MGLILSQILYVLKFWGNAASMMLMFSVTHVHSAPTVHSPGIPCLSALVPLPPYREGMITLDLWVSLVKAAVGSHHRFKVS